MKVAPSLLSADFLNLKEELSLIECSGADFLHLDIMDGHFVPNLTFGPIIIESIKKTTNLPLDIHLMVKNIGFFVDLFIPYKPRFISFHIEEEQHAHRMIAHIKKQGISPSVVLNPHTPLENLDYILQDLDMVLLMSVNPGFGGQSFIPQTLDKIKRLKDKILALNSSCLIEVDGGVNDQNAKLLKEAGADILVAGSYVFGSDDYSKAVQSLKV